MRPVSRDEIVDYVTYNESRDETRAKVMALKKARRIHVGPHLTFLFENRDTVRYQVQEMMRTEQIVREADIQHELSTYNELLGGDGELGCTLLIEIDDPADRDTKLREWKRLPEALYATLEDGSRARFTFDPRQIGEDRLSSVQYLKVDVKGQAPVALGCDHPDYSHEHALSDAERAALATDLADG